MSYRRREQKARQLARQYWSQRLGDAERELIRLGFSIPTTKEEADRLTTLVPKYLPDWPDKAKSPCCILFAKTRKFHSGGCGAGASTGISPLNGSAPPIQSAPGLSSRSSYHDSKRASGARVVKPKFNFSGLRRVTTPTSPAVRRSSQPISASVPDLMAAEQQVEKCRPSAMDTTCKPILHGQLPTRPQEEPFARYLLALDIPPEHRLDVWFTQILGTPDIDAVILCHGVGLFVIELKSWGVSAIKKITAVEGIEVDEHVKKSTRKTPWQQAFEAGDALSGKLSSAPGVNSSARSAWISCGASLFNISRSAFLRRFGGTVSTPYAVKLISEGVLFSEDLSDGTALVQRLKYMKQNPLYRKKPNRFIDSASIYSEILAQDLDRFINYKLIPATTPTASDLERLRRIEDEEEHELERLDLHTNVLCSGFAGTGKTVLGLQAALRAKQSTLFTCFNKVLASDIRRLTAFSRKYQQFPFEVYDIFHLIDTCESRLELSFLSKEDDEEFDAWTIRRVDLLPRN